MKSVYFLFGLVVGISGTAVYFNQANDTVKSSEVKLTNKHQDQKKYIETSSSSKVVQKTNTKESSTKKSATWNASSAENLKASLNIVSDDQLLEYALQTSILDQSTLYGFQDTRAAVYRLIDITLGTEDTLPEEAFDITKVMFSNQKPNGTSYSAQNEFLSTDGDIYAFFELTGYSHHTVLVKWFNVSSNKIVLMKNLPIKTAEAMHHIRINKSAWNQGIYKVEIYALDEEMPLLSSGSYQIVN